MKRGDAKAAEQEGQLTRPEVLATCRPLFAQLQSGITAHGALVLGVTSPNRGEGRSTLALGLASAGVLQLGLEGRVLVVDCDLENPTLHTRCGLEPAPGLPQVVREHLPVAQAMVCVEPGVWLLPAGRALPNPVRQLKELEESQLFVTLGNYFDAVILDLPPVHTPGLGNLPQQLAPQLCLVARSGVTRRTEVRQALAAFPPDHVAAVILNEQRQYVPRLLKRFTN
jgi:Mrp family chromosome partitioning ATPase